MHLHGGAPEGIERAVDFLEDAARQKVDAVFLLGDVFRAWLGRASLRDEGLRPFLEALRNLTREGIWVVMLHGNHDFLMGDELMESCGVDVIAGRLQVSLGDQRVLLTHGDRYCVRDIDYQRLHRVLRSRAMRWLWSIAPPAVLRWVASGLLSSASRATVAKPMSVMSIVDEAVQAELAEGADVVVCGHVHAARDDRLDIGDRSGRLVVMADFETTGSHVGYDDGRLVLFSADTRWAPPPTPVIAIDGPAGSGKSSVSRALARRLGWARLDSGALYRAFALAAIDRGLALDDVQALSDLAEEIDLRLDSTGRVTLDGRAVKDERLRSPEVSAAVSPVAAVPSVRSALLGIQRRAGTGQAGLVAEGRDMASVVFPDATLAIYLDAPLEQRAARRLAQNPSEGLTLEAVVAALRERDDRDSRRATAPLTRAEGAVILNTSDLDLDQVVERVAALIGDRILTAR